MGRITVPTLIVNGDEDWPCLAPSPHLTRTIPSAARLVIPNTGRALSVEEPDACDRVLGDFLAHAESGHWPMRDPRTRSATITGTRG